MNTRKYGTIKLKQAVERSEQPSLYFWNKYKTLALAFLLCFIFACLWNINYCEQLQLQSIIQGMEQGRELYMFTFYG
jgi:hypothetical protein